MYVHILQVHAPVSSPYYLATYLILYPYLFVNLFFFWGGGGLFVCSHCLCSFGCLSLCPQEYSTLLNTHGNVCANIYIAMYIYVYTKQYLLYTWSHCHILCMCCRYSQHASSSTGAQAVGEEQVENHVTNTSDHATNITDHVKNSTDHMIKLTTNVINRTDHVTNTLIM